jgi:hypothetical protein
MDSWLADALIVGDVEEGAEHVRKGKKGGAVAREGWRGVEERAVAISETDAFGFVANVTMMMMDRAHYSAIFGDKIQAVALGVPPIGF